MKLSSAKRRGPCSARGQFAEHRRPACSSRRLAAKRNAGRATAINLFSRLNFHLSARAPTSAREARALPARAFTLMELVLAVGITAIVLVAINGVFFSAMRLRESTTEAVNESLPTQQALAILRRDLAGAMPPTTNGVFSGYFKVGSVASTGLNQPVDIELYTTTGALHDNEPWSEVQRVTYELRLPADRSAPGKDLIRSVTRNLLATIAPPPEDQRMMSGIQSIEFSCYDGTEWRDYWDTTMTDTNLPTAVRVRIQLVGSSGVANSQPIEIIAPIDSQPRTTPAIASNNGT